MNLKETGSGRFFGALQAAGMPKVPEEFSVVPQHQIIASTMLAEIAGFIGVFDRVTRREAWQQAALREAPAIAQLRRAEVCFFSAWDFHLMPGGPFQLIEFNDNGSGFLFAAIINALYYEAAGLEQETSIAAPPSIPAVCKQIGGMVEEEARAFFGECPTELFFILDDAQFLREGKFREEHRLLCDLFRKRGWRAEIGCAAETYWDGTQLLFKSEPVRFIVNRSTDFFWESKDFSGLRSAYERGLLYVAPNPFSYATRSDKRLLEWLSLPHWDGELGIEAWEREILSAHVPETHLVCAANVEMLAQRKHEFVFKPLHGFAGRGLLDSAAVGRERLRRIARHGQGYVAQRFVPKPSLDAGGTPLWTDLRAWAYRGNIFLLSGRASMQPDRLELTPPGGWLPAYVSI
jgi:hypothetical protein